MSSAPAPYERPRLLSVQIPVVEELLAESYRRKAELWADAAGLAREAKAARANKEQPSDPASPPRR